MRNFFSFLNAGAIALLLVVTSIGDGGAQTTKSATGKAAESSGCESFGTSVEFVKTPSEAARRARKAEKLVFVLHVSGNFETPKYT